MEKPTMKPNLKKLSYPSIKNDSGAGHALLDSVRVLFVATPVVLAAEHVEGGHLSVNLAHKRACVTVAGGEVQVAAQGLWSARLADTMCVTSVSRSLSRPP